MKKYIALLSACLMLILTASTAFAAKLDLSYVQERPDFYTIDPSSDGTALFIETVLTAKDRHFIHAYESDYYWSSTMFDILCLGMNSSDQYPVMRLWITYANDIEFKQISGVTIVLDGVSYTFTDIDDPENWYDKTETSYIERMLIKFGADNVSFLSALEKIADRLSTSTEALHTFTATMILHAADEDITVTLGYNFLLEFILMSPAHRNIGGLDALPRVYATPMTVNGGSGSGSSGSGSSGSGTTPVVNPTPIVDDGPSMCNHCYGSGECDHCYGEGSEWCDSCFGSGDCGRCDGFGTLFPNDNRCTSCSGSGVCRRCKGTGELRCNYCNGNGTCNYCKGAGYR